MIPIECPDGLTASLATETKDRRGNAKLDRLILTADTPPTNPPVGRWDPADVRWITQATRRSWSAVTRRYGPEAERIAVRAARDGLVTIEVTTRPDHRAGHPPLMIDTWVCWRRTPAGKEISDTTSARTAAARASLEQTATSAAAAITDLDPGLAATLHRPDGVTDETLQALTYAAADLAEQATFDGPRAWSAHHYPTVQGDPSKHRDDIATLLANNGAATETVDALGLTRAAHLGIGGPIGIHDPDGQTLIAAAVAGVVTFNPNQPHQPTLSGDVDLVIVENLQAAEALARDHTAVIYTLGVPSDAALRTIVLLAQVARRTIIVPDADPGGVRIAARVLTVAPTATVIDVGEQPHQPTRPLTSNETRALEELRSGPAGHLADAIARRGYRLEQEHLTRAAVRAALRSYQTERPG